MRSKSFRPAVLLVCLAMPLVAAGQTVVVGNVPPSATFGFDPGTVTAVDLSTPANATGFATTATFTWSVFPCTAAAKIKFFRRNGDNLQFLAERGPFDVGAFTLTVALSPSVPIEAGDLVGIARVSECGTGGPVAQAQGNPAGFVAFGADVTADIPIASGTTFPDSTLAVQAQGTISEPGPGNETLMGVIPVVTSSAGVAPSFFRTLVQLHNPSTAAISGRLIYHRAGTPGSPTDPSLAYSLGPGQTQSIPDLLPSIGTSGFGSLDVSSSSGPAPLILVRLFNDAGAAGTLGSTEQLVRPEEALGSGDTGVLIGPPDPLQFRFNIGVRSLSDGATVDLVARDAAGAVVATLTKTYPADYMEQSSASVFLGGVPLPPNGTVSAHVVSGSLVLYGSSTDNRTNDPNHQTAKRN